MKLAGRDIAGFCRAPDAALLGCLLHGPDAALVAEARRALVAALSEGDDLRVTRLAGAEIRRDPAALDAALRAQGFFPGRRVVHVEGARDEIAGTAAEVLAEITPADAFLVLEAGTLRKTSALKKLFEGDRRLAAAALYPEPPDAQDLAERLRAAGCRQGLSEEGAAALVALAAELEPAQIPQLIESIALYSLSQEAPLDADAVAALAPQGIESELAALLDAVASGRTREVAPLLGRVASGGGAPVQAVILAGRHFRQLLAVAADPGGLDAGLAKLRPPLFGPRRAVVRAQAAMWPAARAEAAVRLLQETDRTLRSPGQRPERALVERCLIRLSMMAAAR